MINLKNIYEKIANKSANFIGFDNTEIEQDRICMEKLLENSANGALPLKNYLNYRYFDSKSETFLMTGGSAGFLLEICPLVGIDDQTVKSLNLFFSKELPKEGVLQFFLMASCDIDNFLEHWGSGRKSNDRVLKRITSQRIEFLRNRASNFSNSGMLLPRSFRIFVSYSKICKTYNEAALDQIKEFRRILIDRLTNLKMSPIKCHQEDLIRLCREFFEINPGSKANYQGFNKHDTINNQCLSFNNHYENKIDAFVNKSTNICHRAYKFKKFPDFWSLAANINLLGSHNGFPIPARFSLALAISNDYNTDQLLISRGRRSIDASEKSYSRHDKVLQEEALEWREIIHSLESKEESALSESFSLFVSSKSQDIKRAESAIITNLSNYSFEIAPLDYFHLETMLSHMPMQGSNYWLDLKSKKQVEPSLSNEIVSKLPIHGEWHGVPLSGVPLIGKRGQIYNWNPFYRVGSGNFNFNVIGPSGVGKSVFLQELAASMLSQDVRVFILDIGESYASLAKLLGGEIIDFGDDSQFTINPFIGLKENMSDIDFNQFILCAKELLNIMSGVHGEYESAIMEEAIKSAVIKSGFNLDLDGFIEFLKTSDVVELNRFAKSLFSYSKEGIFGKYFSGNNHANFDKLITIFEFQQIKEQPKLISIILQTLLMQITSQFLRGDRSKRFMIIIDEAWMLLDHSAAFFAAFGRNIRRYNGSLAVCTQCFADLQTAGPTVENNNHRKAIFENSAWKINLPPASFTDFESHSAFKEKIPLLKTLSFERGKYSEMLLSTTGVDVVGRLMLDPFSQTVFSTEGDDFAFLKDQERKKIPIEDAIDNLMKKRSNKNNG